MFSSLKGDIFLVWWKDLSNVHVGSFITDYSLYIFIDSIQGKNIKWRQAEEFPSCQRFDLFDYYDMDSFTPDTIFFAFNKIDGLGATLLLEDRNRQRSSKKEVTFEQKRCLLSLEEVMFQKSLQLFALSYSRTHISNCLLQD